ncbi:MAG: hypothetical protein IT462_00385 [Planctomycetes bacterium]|nr:hypothetical protein [Planctomycetota bacterium]
MKTALPFALLCLLSACAAGVPAPAPTVETAPPRKETLVTLPDRGERALVEALFAAAAKKDTDAVAALTTTFLAQEASAVHGSAEEWLDGFADAKLDFGALYSRNGAPGRFQSVKVTSEGGSVDLGFYIVDDRGLQVDNILSLQPVIPGATAAVYSSRAHVLRAFWAYYGALVGVAPEFLPDRAEAAPAISLRLRLASWRSSVQPELRARMLRNGPEKCREHVPNYLDHMGRVLGDFFTPQVREANLVEGRAVVLFTPTDAAAEKGTRPFSLVYRSGWWHGMQVISAEQEWKGQ